MTEAKSVSCSKYYRRAMTKTYFNNFDLTILSQWKSKLCIFARVWVCEDSFYFKQQYHFDIGAKTKNTHRSIQ